MSTVKSKKLQVGTDASASNNFTIYQPAVPDGTLRVGVGNADNPTEVGRFTSAGYKPATAPLMQVHLDADQTLSQNTVTKLNFGTVNIDTTGDYDSTNKRWIPSVAGYYKIYITFHPDMASSSGNWYARIFVNGTGTKLEYTMTEPQLAQNQNVRCSAIIYLNGTTDYVEAYANHNVAGTKNVYSPSIYTYFEGHLIQQA